MGKADQPLLPDARGGSLIYPDYRRRGLAEAVLRFLLDEARKSAVAFIALLDTAAGLPLYEKLSISASKFAPMMMLSD